MQRIVLFLITNIAIMTVLSIVFFVLDMSGWLDARGIGLQYGPLLIFSVVIGFGGAFISLLMSKWMAKRATGAHVIETPQSATEQWLVDTVAKQAREAGIGMPEVAIFPSDSPNAFATGAKRDDALVAVSTGLLHSMSREEVEAVLGHEVSHVANGDMVTLTLIQGVLNTFVIFFARVLGHVVDRVVLRNERGRGIGYFLSVIAFQILLGILATMIVAWFSRRREYRADAGGARLAGRRNMADALRALKRVSSAEQQLPENLAAFGISSGGVRKLFSTHPPLEDRIARLERGT